MVIFSLSVEYKSLTITTRKKRRKAPVNIYCSPHSSQQQQHPSPFFGAFFGSLFAVFDTLFFAIESPHCGILGHPNIIKAPVL
jgi:hypothetical protein